MEKISEISNSDVENKITLLKNKVEQYEKSYDQYRLQSYNETEIRVDFVNFLFQLIGGWDVLNEGDLPQHLRAVIREANVTVEGNGKNKTEKTDYALKIGTEVLFI